MVAGNFLPAFLMKQMKTNKLPVRSRLRWKAFRSFARTRKSRRFFRRKNKKQVSTETFKYFAKWA